MERVWAQGFKLLKPTIVSAFYCVMHLYHSEMYLMCRKLTAFYFDLFIVSFLSVFGFFKVQVHGDNFATITAESARWQGGPNERGKSISRSSIQMPGKKTDVLWSTPNPGKHNGKFIEDSGVTPALSIKKLLENSIRQATTISACLFIEYLFMLRVLLIIKTIHQVSLSYHGWTPKRSPVCWAL